MANRWLYEVSAEFEDAATAQAWATWMLEVHIADVIAAGALCGRLLRSAEGMNTFVGQYEFESEAALRKYLEEQSPRLRAEAAKRFDPAGVKYSRRTAEILAHNSR